MELNKELLENEITSYLTRVKCYVINRRDLYPSRLTDSQIMEITFHTGANVEKVLENRFAGYTIKDEEKVKEWEGAKRFDFVISLSTIKTFAKNKGINEVVALKSVITHEFVHAVSVGFALDDTKECYDKDEEFTDFYAEEIFKAICPDSEYIATRGKTSTYATLYNTERNAYFAG